VQLPDSLSCNQKPHRLQNDYAFSILTPLRKQWGMMLQCHQIAMEFLVMLSTPPQAMGYAIINQNEKSLNKMAKFRWKGVEYGKE